MNLPATKRVRWDDMVEPPQDHHHQRPNAIEKNLPNTATPPDICPLPSTSCKANDAIRLSSVRSVDELGPEDVGHGGFRPTFTHQLFDDEKIEGYSDGDVKIRLLYVAASLHFLVKISTSDKDAVKKADIMTRLTKALPAQDQYTIDELSFRRQLEWWRRGFMPPGTRVHEYKKNSKTFSVYRATGEDTGAREYHGRAQCLAPWFIESADSIDLEDDRWEVFYIFEEAASREVLSEKWRPEAFVGYFTVFGFRNPVKGVSLRICQALILPQFQRRGHGQALLAYVYSLARSRESVFEVTVEDPAPGFEKVRNFVDAQTLRDHKVFPAELLAPNTFKRPPKDVVQAAHEAVKLTVSQVEIGFDVLKARDVKLTAGFSSPASSAHVSKPSSKEISCGNEAVSVTGNQKAETDDSRKCFRLMVKRRLLKGYGEELSTDSATRKRQLEELYREVEGGILSLGAKLRAEKSRDAGNASQDSTPLCRRGK